jgi:predicted RNase H-related nuclease YkuK (DUF458 family)
MEDYRKRFRKYNGEEIGDIIDYLSVIIKSNPEITIAVGCDSKQKRRITLYACTIMMYNKTIRNGAHVVFFRKSFPKIKNLFQRLTKEAEIALEVSEFLEKNLKWNRRDLTDFERKSYKYHLEKCNGRFIEDPHNLEGYIKNLQLSPADTSIDFRPFDIHLDFNPVENFKNKSNPVYKSFVPYLRGSGWRVFVKPIAWGSTSAADLLVKK